MDVVIEIKQTKTTKIGESEETIEEAEREWWKEKDAGEDAMHKVIPSTEWWTMWLWIPKQFPSSYSFLVDSFVHLHSYFQS
jgi:hypothetical protein